MILGGVEYNIEQKRLRDWLSLNETLGDLEDAAGHTDRKGTASSICRYVSAALGLSLHDVIPLPWDEVAVAFNEIQKANAVDLSHIAFTRLQTVKQKEEAWDYPGRLWWTWAHDFARAFGWTVEYIAALPVLDAFSLLQENLLHEYFEREWQWTLSEYSVKYNQSTKKSEPNPLPKPDWMKVHQAVQTAKVTKLPKGMVPVGNVLTPPQP